MKSKSKSKRAYIAYVGVVVITVAIFALLALNLVNSLIYTANIKKVISLIFNYFLII